MSAPAPPAASQGLLCNVCGGPGNIHDGCAVQFPRMQPGGSGLCMRCRKLKDPMVSADEKARLQSDATVQCDECGICGTTVTNPCGTCRRLMREENNLTDPTLDTAAYQRHNRLQARMNRSPFTPTPSQGPSCSQQPMFGATTPMSELQALAQAQHIHHVPQPVGHQHVKKVLINLEIRRSDNPKQTDKALGVSCLPYPETLTMLELQQQLVTEANSRWVDHYPMLLSWEDTSLRVPGNILVPQESLSLPISEWYRRYSSPEFRNTFIIAPRNPVGSGRRNAKPNASTLIAFSLELFIHVDRFLERLSPDIASQLAAKAGSKRKTSGPQDSPGSKRARSENTSMQSRVLQSRFVPDGDLLMAAPPVVSVHAIDFLRTTCTIEAVTGQPTLHESSTAEHGQLAIKPLIFGKSDTGRTKEVYSLQLGNSQYAAKKLTNIGKGVGIGIDIQTAIRILSADLVRLKRMNYFAKLFIQAASQKSVEIADFEVTDGFILKTYSTPSDSRAEGDTTETVTAETSTDGDCGLTNSSVIPTAVYLVEPFRRNSSVTNIRKNTNAR